MPRPARTPHRPTPMACPAPTPHIRAPTPWARPQPHPMAASAMRKMDAHWRLWMSVPATARRATPSRAHSRAVLLTAAVPAPAGNRGQGRPLAYSLRRRRFNWLGEVGGRGRRQAEAKVCARPRPACGRPRRTPCTSKEFPASGLGPAPSRSRLPRNVQTFKRMDSHRRPLRINPTDRPSNPLNLQANRRRIQRPIAVRKSVDGLGQGGLLDGRLGV